jgi:hypothetical protein
MLERQTARFHKLCEKLTSKEIAMKNKQMSVKSFFYLIVALCFVDSFVDIAGAQAPQNLLKNGEFTALENGVPSGWSFYGKKEAGALSIENNALRLEDNSSEGEIGITQTVPAESGKMYGVRAVIRELAPGSTQGAFLQLRFLPSQKFEQIGLVQESADEWQDGAWSSFVVSGVAPAGTTSAQVYLYSHAQPTPKMLVQKVELAENLKSKNAFAPPIPPQYSRLKPLHSETAVIRRNQAMAKIAIAADNPNYRAAAQKLQQQIKAQSGVEIPIIPDSQIKIPLEENAILLGNRSTNAAIGTLYDRFFALTDLKYPGAGGHELRSVHNPFGNGFNAIIAGGSDDAGVAAAVGVLLEKLRVAKKDNGDLSLGFLLDIKLGDGVALPKELKDFQTWEDSKGYGNAGYFGWNSISKRLAMYAMTGDESQAREALRLAFPDAETKKEIARVDGELIENKDDPLAGTYHYNSTHMILFWDLVEESPVFSDAERLKVINAFSRQLEHRVENDGNIYGLRGPAQSIGSRHGLYGALSLFALSRYFHRDDPDSPVWNQAFRASNFYFAPLAQPRPWVFGENDNLFWYSTGLAPILTYMTLSGDYRGLQSGAIAELLRGQELLFNGRSDDRQLQYAALDYLHKAANLTRDGRWIFYRDRTGLDTDIFRLGQSFWPDETLKAAAPTDLLNRWIIGELPPAYAAGRDTGFPKEQSFTNASFRTATDGGGDFLLLDGLNGSGRNPYHTFAILELRMDGKIVLQGYNNQVQTKADGRVEPIVALDAAHLQHEVLGQTATFSAAVPRAPFCDWTRTIAQRIGNYALVVDDLKFQTDSENFQAQFLWQKLGSGWSEFQGGARLAQNNAGANWKINAPAIRALDAKLSHAPIPGNAVAELPALSIVVLRADQTGQWLDMPFEVRENWRGKLWARLLDYNDRGIVKFSLDGKELNVLHDSYAPGVQPAEVDLGERELEAGTHVLRVEVAGKNAQSRNSYIGLFGVALETFGAPINALNTAPQVVSADALTAQIKGSIATQIWEGKSTTGQIKKFFSLVGQGSVGQALAAQRLSETAAMLRTPLPALAVAGEFQNSSGDLIVLENNHAFGKSARRAGAGSTLLSASAPIDFDWDFESGQLHVACAQATDVALAVEPSAKLMLAGKPLGSTPDAGGVKLSLPVGRHVLTNARLTSKSLEKLKTELAQWPIEAPNATREHQAGSTPATAKLQTVFNAKASGAISATAIAQDAGKTRLFAASGKTITEFDGAGKTVRTMQTDGAIRVLHWWPQHQLLVAGCIDEKVIAFDSNGNRRWEFVSVMAPEVFRAGKQYWFKSAPGHGGIHGLDSGAFLNDQTQLFVGSACTLEILDENGKLLKRLPQFWGTVALFEIVPAANGGRNLLAARSITEYPNLAVINNKTLDPSLRSFRDVPPGVTPVNGWTDQARFHIFHLDVDGDGEKEIVSEITGAWNRVTVWSESGAPKYNVQFGPGENVYGGGMNQIGIAPIRDIDVADIDGDERPEILVALESKLIVALNGRCEVLWSRKLDEVPTALKIANGRIYVGCENGEVLALGEKGKTLAREKLGARVNDLKTLPPVGNGSTPIVAIAGDGSLHALVTS